jgi:acyl carrier protein
MTAYRLRNITSGGIKVSTMASTEERLISLIQRMSGNVNVSLDSTVNLDLNIQGDDAVELIEEIHNEFGTKFNGMDMRRFFKDEGIEILLKFFKQNKTPLSVRHLLDVVERGSWFEPTVA